MKLGAACTVVAFSLHAFAARAESADPAAAEALFREGRELADVGDHAGACAKFHESARLDPALGTTFNIADCEEKQGHLARAWTLYREVAQRLPVSDRRRPMAEQRLRALEPRLPWLNLRLRAGAPASTRVERDGVELGAASLGSDLPIDPGIHVVRLSAPGHHPREYRVELVEGERLTLDVEPGASAPAATSDTTLAQSSGAVLEGDSGRRTAGYVSGAVGLLGLLTAGAFGYLVLDAKSTVDDDCDASALEHTIVNRLRR
jgi:hypothetical protein